MRTRGQTYEGIVDALVEELMPFPLEGSLVSMEAVMARRALYAPMIKWCDCVCRNALTTSSTSLERFPLRVTYPEKYTPSQTGVENPRL
jgi:hypothetical protein